MKVAVVFPYMAHYRRPIVELLTEERSVEYLFLYGKNPSPQFENLKLMDIPDSENFKSVRTIWFFKYFSIQSDLIRTLQNCKVDAVIIYADSKYLSTWLAIFYLKKNNIPVYFWSHGFRKNKKSLNDFIKNIYFKLFNGGFVFDHRAKKVFRDKGINYKIDVIYNSLDFVQQDNVYKSLGIEDNHSVFFSQYKPYVIYTGRLSLNKNLKILLQAIYHLKEEGVVVNAVLIGDGVCKDALVKEAEDLNILDQVIFYGSCYDESIIGSSYKNAIVSVIPSGVGLSAIHAMTYGCPVITDDNDIRHGPEVEAIREGVTGAFYRCGDWVSLADKIKSFVMLKEAERYKFETNVREIVEDKYNPTYQREVFNARFRNI